MQRECARPRLLVGLVSWNNRRDLLICLAALYRQTYPNVQVVVVDNGSTDGTPVMVRQYFPEVRCAALVQNYGFARAANVILGYARQADADYVLLLNADTSFGPDLLERLVDAAEARPDVGIFSPKIYLRAAPERLWAIGGVLERGRVRFYGLNRYDTGQFDGQTLDFVMGCAMLLRTAILPQTGPFDGRFFLFYEEIDLCLRAKQAGWPIALLPEVQLWHEGGATTRQQHHVREFYLARSRLVFLRKYRTSFDLRLLVLYELALTTKVVALHLSQRSFRAGAAYLSGAAVGLFRRGRAIYEPYETR